MSDQPAFAIDNIRIAVLPDFEAGDHVPDKLQIDLGERDTAVTPGVGQRQRHVGFGFLAKINRAEPEIEGAVEQQHEADQPDDQQHIFAEELPATAASGCQVFAAPPPRPKLSKTAERSRLTDETVRIA